MLHADIPAPPSGVKKLMSHVCRMNLNLRIIQDRTYQYRVESPCTGQDAKALGKYKLEEETGMSVKFASYQEAHGRPEVQLANNDKVHRGAILNFAVNLDTLIQHQKHHTDLLRGIYDSKLRTLIAKYSSRLITKTHVASDDLRNRGTLVSHFDSSQQHTKAAETVLASVGSQMTAKDFAAGLDSAYAARNGEWRHHTTITAATSYPPCVLFAAEQHINTDEQLKYEFDCMRKAGVVQLMVDVMPLECLIVNHYEEFLLLKFKSLPMNGVE